MRGVFAALLLMVNTAAVAADAHLYLGAGFDFGGDKLAETDDSQDLRAGQGLSLTVGMDIDMAPNFMLRATIGHKWDALEADNGEADIKHTQLEVLGYHFFGEGFHGLGAGLTHHRNIKFSCDVDFLCSGTIQADDTNGLVVEYLYRTKNDGSSGATIGVRAATGLDYDFGGTETVDANYIGANIGLSF